MRGDRLVGRSFAIMYRPLESHGVDPLFVFPSQEEDIVRLPTGCPSWAEYRKAQLAVWNLYLDAREGN